LVLIAQDHAIPTMPLLTAGSSGSSTTIMSARHTNLPATIIFSPKEMKQYQRWQRQILRLKNQQLGKLPTATQYDEYLRWREKRKQESECLPEGCRLNAVLLGEHLNQQNPATPKQKHRATASTCKHALHPGSSTGCAEMCPCCIIGAHMRYMDLLTHLLERFDAEPGSWAMRLGSDHERALEAWYYGKLHLVQTVQEFETLASQEAQWHDSHPGTCLEGIMSASKALHIYWANLDPTPCERTCPEQKARKRVRFGEDTSFEPGRPVCYFWKESPRYEPGRFSDADTSEEDESVFSFGSNSPEKDDGEVERDGDGDMEGVQSDDESHSGDTGEETEDSDEEDCTDMEIEGCDGDFIMFGY
jgi:hypothetical protein